MLCGIRSPVCIYFEICGKGCRAHSLPARSQWPDSVFDAAGRPRHATHLNGIQKFAEFLSEMNLPQHLLYATVRHGMLASSSAYRYATIYLHFNRLYICHCVFVCSLRVECS